MAVWALNLWFPAVFGMVPCASTVETTSAIPSLGGTYVHHVWVLVSQGLVVVSVLGPAYDEV